MATPPFGTEPKTVVSLLIQLSRKWQHLHLGTEPKTVVSLLIQLSRKWQHLHLGQSQRLLCHYSYSCQENGNISIWDRAKDCCVITHTVVKKMATSPFGYRAKDCCVITDTVIRKSSTSPFAHRDQDVVEHVKCRQKMAKI